MTCGVCFQARFTDQVGQKGKRDGKVWSKAIIMGGAATKTETQKRGRSLSPTEPDTKQQHELVVSPLAPDKQEHKNVACLFSQELQRHLDVLRPSKAGLA